MAYISNMAVILVVVIGLLCPFGNLDSLSGVRNGDMKDSKIAARE
jgi:hypothetical protein